MSQPPVEPGSEQPGDQPPAEGWQPPQPPAQPPAQQPAQPPQPTAPYEPPPAWGPPQEPSTPPPAPEWAPPPGIGAPLPPSTPPPGYGPWETLGADGAPVPPGPPITTGKHRGRLILAAAAVVVVAAGGTVSYVALSSSSSNGAKSPQSAVQSIVSDINKSDLIGVLNDLAPGERDALVKPVTEAVNQLKRANVLQGTADPSSVTGLQVALTNLTFGGSPIKINDHVQIVQITGGSVRINADLTRVPFTKNFLDAAFPGGVSNVHNTTTVDIATAIKNNGGKPVRIAVQKVGGTWYPSIAYTIADSAANQQVPSANDAIPAVGASSSTEAVKQEITALIGGDYRKAIQLLSPDETAAVHDYGGLILAKASHTTAPFKLTDLQLTSTAIDGGQRVTLQKISFEAGDTTGTVAIDGSCVDATIGDQHNRLCAEDLVSAALSGLQALGLSDKITDQQRQALADVVGAVGKIGVDVVQVGGFWYVAPARSLLDEFNVILSGLHGDDAAQIATMVHTLSGH